MEYQEIKDARAYLSDIPYMEINFGMVSVAIYSLTFIIVNKSCPLQYTP